MRNRCCEESLSCWKASKLPWCRRQNLDYKSVPNRGAGGHGRLGLEYWNPMCCSLVRLFMCGRCVVCVCVCGLEKPLLWNLPSDSQSSLFFCLFQNKTHSINGKSLEILTLHSSMAGIGSLYAVLSKRWGKVVEDAMGGRDRLAHGHCHPSPCRINPLD